MIREEDIKKFIKDAEKLFHYVNQEFGSIDGPVAFSYNFWKMYLRTALNLLRRKYRRNKKVLYFISLVYYWYEHWGWYEEIKKLLRYIPCRRCGWCCRNIPVHVTKHELEVIALELRVSLSSIIRSFVHRSKKGYLFLRTPCPFLIKENGKYFCSIYSVRPTACRLFPFHPELRVLLEINNCPLANWLNYIMKESWGVLKELTEQLSTPEERMLDEIIEELRKSEDYQTPFTHEKWVKTFEHLLDEKIKELKGYFPKRKHKYTLGRPINLLLLRSLRYLLEHPKEYFNYFHERDMKLCLKRKIRD